MAPSLVLLVGGLKGVQYALFGAVLGWITQRAFGLKAQRGSRRSGYRSYFFQPSWRYSQLPSFSTGKKASAASPPHQWPPPIPSSKPDWSGHVTSTSSSLARSLDGYDATRPA